MSFDPTLLPLPPGLQREKWAEWIDYRRQSGGRVTVREIGAALATLDEWINRGLDAHALIDWNIRHGFPRLRKPHQVGL